MQVNHPNIVTLFGFCDSHLYLIMELCEETLYNVLHKRKDVKITWGHAIQWSKDIAKTVNYLHSITPKPLLHRDLKPANVLLVDQGRVIKLSDFGSMRQEADKMTNGIGTAIYMAPEVFATMAYTTKCDVYSWGIMLWEILCRKIPHSSLDRYVILYQKVMRKARPAKLEGCPDRIQNIIHRCWDQDPNLRPTMSEVAEEMTEIREILKGELRSVYLPPDDVLSGPLQGLVRVSSTTETSTGESD